MNTVLTIDDDFERFDAFDTEVVLSPAEFSERNRFLENGFRHATEEEWTGRTASRSNQR